MSALHGHIAAERAKGGVFNLKDDKIGEVDFDRQGLPRSITSFAVRGRLGRLYA